MAPPLKIDQFEGVIFCDPMHPNFHCLLLLRPVSKASFHPIMYLGGNHHNHNGSSPPPRGDMTEQSEVSSITEAASMVPRVPSIDKGRKIHGSLSVTIVR